MVLVQSKTVTVNDPAFKAAIKDAAKTVGALPIDDIALPAIMLIGLAVGIDYSLFYIRRER